MTRLTVTIDDKTNARRLLRMLRALKFVKNIETEDYPVLTDEQIQILEERAEEYRKNPHSARPWKQVHSEIKKKYGL